MWLHISLQLHDSIYQLTSFNATLNAELWGNRSLFIVILTHQPQKKSSRLIVLPVEGSRMMHNRDAKLSAYIE